MENQSSQARSQRQTRRFNESQRREHVSNWQHSGLPAKAYAREHALNYKSLYAWRRQLSEGTSSPRLQHKDATFVPVSVSEAALSSTAAISITLRSGSFECAISAAASEPSLVALVKSIKEEVFDV
jgi:transposase-like protein